MTVDTAAPADQAATAPAAGEQILTVNNIEVIYDHVILVCEGGVTRMYRKARLLPFSAPTVPARQQR